MRLWLRAESSETERRSPLSPEGAGELIRAGHDIIVEAAPHRIFQDEAFEAVGCSIEPRGSWVSAPENCYVLGLKELPPQPDELVHRHIYFAHAYKKQAASIQLLKRFTRGGGLLLDLEYLRDQSNRRVAAFGHWAGVVGSALALIQWGTRFSGGLAGVLKEFAPFTQSRRLNEIVRKSLGEKLPTVIIIGAGGRCGGGSVELCGSHGIRPTLWGRGDARSRDLEALLGHDILVNCALISELAPPLLREQDVMRASRRLSVISDVSCDQKSPYNSMPVIPETTTWHSPVRRLLEETHPAGVLDGIAIDNLPSLLPKESSDAFAAALLPYLFKLSEEEDLCWRSARCEFESQIEKAGLRAF
ncbi:hypothetical protein [Bradyrhizobium sp. SZCCHNS1012]|uniref:hypothetical protein n=1 Tax=unclassified Bradyrhizobium TaxID=2631580 RepID=UPI0039675CD0